MDDVKELLRQVRRIELRTRQAMTELTAGAYRSRFKGQGMTFEEVREYVPGDDVRHIDWNVSARYRHPFVKVFREERELTVILLVDLSASMRFGAIPGLSPRSKMSAAAEAAAVVAITALHNKDQIGLLGFTDRCEVHLAPKRGRGHTMRVVREILAPREAGHGTSICNALDDLQHHSRKQAIVFVISDFLHPELTLASKLQQVRRRHDVIGLRVADPAEQQLPVSDAPLAMRDPETGQELLLASNARNRAKYEHSWNEQRDRVQKCFRAAGADLVDLSTTDNVIMAIQRFFARRRRTVGAS
jgi:uncharacterized protein (DUF58 family)